MSDNVVMKIVNIGAFLSGVAAAQKLSLRYGRTELKRGAQRIRKTFIKEQLQGPPGIKAGSLAKGKNVWTFVTGATHKDMSAKIGISRILHVHEKGLTIKGTGGMLYLREKGSGPRASRAIIAVVPQVTIPKRLHFRTLVAREAPAMLLKVGKESARGVSDGISKALKGTVARSL